MPIYEYVCQDCNKKYDKFIRSLTAKVELKCPKCGSPRGEKALSAFSARSAGSLSVGGTAGSSAAACGPAG